MKALMVSVLLGGILFSAGCCLFAKVDAHAPVAPGNVLPASTVPSTAVRLSDISIVQKGGSLVIEGTLHPRSFMQKETGYVDVRIVDSDGNLLQQIKAIPDSPVFREKNDPLPRFSVSVNMVPPKGARVHLHPHE